MEKININTIAKIAKASNTTVSNYINGTETFPISDDTARRIRQAMRELNYRPHPGASLIRRNRADRKKIGFVFGENSMLPVFEVMIVPLIQQILVETSAAFAKENYDLVILNVSDEKSRSLWNEIFIDVEAVINYGQINALMYDTLIRRNIPLIELSPTEDYRVVFGNIDQSELHHIFWRSDRQIVDIFESFYRQQARKFVFVSSWNIKRNRPDFYGYDAEAKVDGFLAALNKHPDATGTVLSPPLPKSDSSMNYEFESGRVITLQHLDIIRQSDAIIAHNDIVARGIASVLTEDPDLSSKKILLSGEGDFTALRYWHPKITTSSVDYDQLTRNLVAMVKNIAGAQSPQMFQIEIATH